MTRVPSSGGLRPAAIRPRTSLPTGHQAIATGCRQPLRESLGIAKVGRFRPACAGRFLHTSYTAEWTLLFPRKIKWLEKSGPFAGMSGFRLKPPNVDQLQGCLAEPSLPKSCAVIGQAGPLLEAATKRIMSSVSIPCAGPAPLRPPRTCQASARYERRTSSRERR